LIFEGKQNKLLKEFVDGNLKWNCDTFAKNATISALTEIEPAGHQFSLRRCILFVKNFISKRFNPLLAFMEMAVRAGNDFSLVAWQDTLHLSNQPKYA
jgi:hypothetical protein